MRSHTLAAILVATGAATALAGVSSPFTTLIIEDQDIGGGALVTSINNIDVNNSGDWLVEFDTNIADTDFDVLVSVSGVITYSEGQGLGGPVGANLDSFDSLSLNNNGDIGANYFLDGTSGSNDDSGVYVNTTLIKQESQLSGAPGLSPGTPFIGFFDVKINDSGLLLVLASIDDPNVSSTVDRALIVVDPSDGSETLIAAEGGVLPGVGGVEVADFETGAHDTDFNNNGDVMFIADLNAGTTEDSAVYINDTLIAREGSPSPVDGINYGSLASGVVDINNNGNYVFRGLLDTDAATNTVIINDGEVFAREGDAAPGGNVFTAFGSGPVLIADNGDVAWFGDWDGDTATDKGIFINGDLIVQEGVTEIGGLVVDSIPGFEDTIRFSDNGQYLIFEATLEGGLNGAFLYTVPLPTGCPGDANGDFVVDALDLNIVLAQFGQSGPDLQGDLNDDDNVDALDLNEVLSFFGTGCI